MGNAASTAEQHQDAHEVVERDGVTYLYDAPRHSVYVRGFDVGRFLLLLAGYETITVLMVFLAMSRPTGGLIVLLYGVACGFVAAHFARLRVAGPSWWAELGPQLKSRAMMAGAIVLLQWLTQAMHGVFLIGFLVRWVYYLVGLGLISTLAFTGPSSIAMIAGVEMKRLPRVVMALAALRERQAQVAVRSEQLHGLRLFDAADPALVSAWQCDDTDRIEHLLKAGDALNRESWQRAIDGFNAFKDDIDIGRGRLRHLVREADMALMPYAIDYAALSVDRSGVMEGAMQAARLPEKGIMQTLDYGRGVSHAITKAATGNVPWQLAAVAVVFSGVMMLANHQKLLRQLKELEGTIAAQATAVHGDIRLIGDEISLRMAPQFDGLVQLIERLEQALQRLRSAESSQDGQAKAHAFALACLFREAKYLLEMKAGN